MDRVLLDSDVIIWYLRGRESTRAWVQELSRPGVPCCSTLSVTEVVAGLRPREETATREFLQALQVVDVDRNIAWQAGELIGGYGRRGMTLDFVDAIIAATCLRHRLLLATHNVKHYPIRELRLAQNPVSP
jgi:predicted nucleic acid-binding protein